MNSRPKPTDREAVYDEAWADPISVVAERYGMSDVGLSKVCKRLSVPYPRRGLRRSPRSVHFCLAKPDQSDCVIWSAVSVMR